MDLLTEIDLKREREKLSLSGRKRQRDRTEESQEKKNRMNLTLSVRTWSSISYVGSNVLVGVTTIENNLAKSNEREMESYK